MLPIAERREVEPELGRELFLGKAHAIAHGPGIHLARRRHEERLDVTGCELRPQGGKALALRDFHDGLPLVEQPLGQSLGRPDRDMALHQRLSRAGRVILGRGALQEQLDV